MAYATNGNQESGFYKTIASLGKAIGLGVSIMVTPVLFNHTKEAIWGHLHQTFGTDISFYLTWIMGAVEAYVIYVVTGLTFTAVAVSTIAAMAARRYSGE